MGAIKAKAVLAIKNNAIFRKAIKPVVENLRKKELLRYIESPESAKIAGLKNKFAGKRCFIVGNGPSLSIEDLEKIENEYSFGANAIYQLFEKTRWRPTFYSCVDTVSFQMFGDKLAKLDTQYKFFDTAGRKYIGVDSASIYYIYQKYAFKIHRWEYEQPQISEDVSKGVSLGYTVTFTAIQLAIYMGFKEIYLIGIDHNYAKKVDSKGKVVEDNSKTSYCKDLVDSGTGIQYTDITTAAYESARDYAQRNGIVIKNASRGGCLEVFERVVLEDVLKGSEK